MRRLVIMLLVLVALILAVFAYCLNERRSGQASLRAIQRELTEAGLLHSLSDLTPAASPEALENGKRLLAEIAGLKDLRAKSAAVREGPELINYVAPGIAEPIISKASPSYWDGTKSAERNWEDLRAQLQPGTPIIAKATQRLSEPVALEYDYAFPGEPWKIDETQDLVVWLRAVALIKLRGGDTTAVINHLQAIAKVSESVSEIGTLVTRTVGTVLWSYGGYDLCWEILQTDSLTDADLSRLHQIISHRNFVESAQRAVAVEGALIDSYYSWMKKTPSLDIIFGTQQGDGILGSPFGMLVRNRCWPILWADGDQAQALSNFGDGLRAGKELIRSRNAEVLNQRIDPVATGKDDRWRYPMAAVLFAGGTGESVYRAAIRLETKRQMLIAAIALEQYRLANNNEYPRSLDALIPAYLAAQPHDWFDGKPLKYKRLEDGTFLLYSVGKDSVDDGGDMTPITPTKSLDMESGRDLIWPRPTKKRPTANFTSPTAAPLP